MIPVINFRKHTPLSKQFVVSKTHAAKSIFLKVKQKINEAFSITNQTIFFKACEQGNMRLIKLAIAGGANITWLNKKGQSAFDLAYCHNHINILKFLALKGYPIPTHLSTNTPFLLHACHTKNKQMIRFLLNHGISVNQTNSDGETPLHIAAGIGDIDIITLLFEKKANVHAETNDLRTPLHFACKYGNLEAAKILIENQANLSHQDKNKNTPLHLVFYNNDANRIIRSLLLKNSNPSLVNLQNNKGQTLLFLATISKNLHLIHFLIEQGAAQIPDINGKTPKDYAENNLELLRAFDSN